MKRPIIIISGPTSSGKTGLSIHLAKKHQAEIINFDSLLFYQGLDIGTAKPSSLEMDNIPHHFVSFRSPANPLNAHSFIELAIPKINELLDNSKTVILVGGSGFYLQAIIKGMYQSKKTDPKILKRSENLYETEGIASFLTILKENDIESYERYHANDHYRIRRAVEYFWLTGLKFSQARSLKDKENQNQENWNSEKFNWDLLHLHLDLPKEQHLKIIEKRTQKMIDSGLIQEVQGLLKKFPNIPKPLQSIGYKETIDYLNGKVSLEQCIERINISTRQLAKSQRTWFNKVDKLTFNPLEQRDKIDLKVDEFLYE